MAGPGFTIEQLREAFFNFDTDRDGAISTEDLKVVLMSKGAKMSREEVDEMLGEVDFDGDGWVMYDELLKTCCADRVLELKYCRICIKKKDRTINHVKKESAWGRFRK